MPLKDVMSQSPEPMNSLCSKRDFATVIKDLEIGNYLGLFDESNVIIWALIKRVRRRGNSYVLTLKKEEGDKSQGM
jgi:hypothetical protein